MANIKAEKSKVVFLRLPESLVDNLDFWANKKGFKNKQAYIEHIVKNEIKEAVTVQPTLLDSIIKKLKE